MPDARNDGRLNERKPISVGVLDLSALSTSLAGETGIAA